MQGMDNGVQILKLDMQVSPGEETCADAGYCLDALHDTLHVSQPSCQAHQGIRSMNASDTIDGGSCALSCSQACYDEVCAPIAFVTCGSTPNRC